MARMRTLAQLREEVRQRADMVNSGFVTNAEVDRCINQSWAQLYDRLLATGEDYYIKYVDIGPQGSTSTATSPYTLSSVGLSFVALPPLEINGYAWSIGTSEVIAFDLATGETKAVVTGFAPPFNPCTKSDFDGTQLVLINASADSVVGVIPTVPTPTIAFQTTAWSPPLSVNEGFNAESGVLFDPATGEYITAVVDGLVPNCRVIRFSISGTTAIESASATFPISVASNGPALVYVNAGRVGVAIDGTFYELDTTTLATVTSIAGAPPECAGGAFDPTTKRVVLVADFGAPAPVYPVLDTLTATSVGSLDAGIAALGVTVGQSFPTLAPDGRWILASAFGTPPTALAGSPEIVAVDPATLACEVIASIPTSVGLWGYVASNGVLLAGRLLNLVLSYQSAAVYALTSTTVTSTAFADFEDYTSSNGQAATDVYQVRGVDAVYASNLIVNLPRYNWEERNLYNAMPELTPYSPISAYRVIQNPVTGNDCIEFIPATPNGVNYYRVWYYPNPKVLTQDTDTLDGRSGWEEWVVVDAAIKLLAKEESDTSQLEREAQRVWARVMAVAENRDAGQGKRITDVSLNSGAWPYPMGYPRRF